LTAWWIAAGALLVLLYVVYRGRTIEPSRVVVERHTLAVPGLPPALDGMELVHISDLHLSGHLGDQERRLVQWIRSHPAPVAVFTGDFIAADGAWGHLVSMMMEMTRGKRTFAVLGDQDYASGRSTRLVAALEGCGITVLRNRAVTLSAQAEDGSPGYARDEDKLWLVGLDDPVTGRADVEAAFADVKEGAPVVVLCHSPEAAPEAIRRGARLVLAGHTLGGKVRLPVVGPLGRVASGLRGFDRGLVVHEGAHVYVNRGFGTPQPVFRWGAPPEVAVLKLVRPG